MTFSPNYVLHTFMETLQTTFGSAAADWPKIDGELARTEAQLMELAKIRAAGLERMRQLARRIARLERCGIACPPAMALRRRRFARALRELAYVETIVVERRKKRIAELGIIHH